ncbi:hybrid sensor histidine kinase/response regulator [Ideonella sp. 4Y16]|uniref:ATP-binding response regulator n=1 Tax=Ideonella alba TaxID=2824118 RepID=UPI001B39C5C3|nr:hybrid sensor histidine kinase/response regulator [Ideonella alba]MBQ0944093.1 hybrid sensor histidine kinase/response regulator [Ideonella alba]
MNRAGLQGWCSAWVLVLAALMWPLMAWPQAVEAPSGLQLLQAEQRHGQDDWQPVALPLQWRAGQAERIELRLSLTLQAQPQGLWALRFDRLPTEHELLINGERVSGREIGRRPALPRTVSSRWISVPSGLLRAGPNEILLRADLHRSAAGLSAPWVGPAEQLEPLDRRMRWWRESLPYAMNLAVSGLALFTLLVWWLRRDERLMGFFGLLMLIVSLRNLAYYGEASAQPSMLGSLGFFLAQGTSVALIVAFAWVASQPPPHRRALRVVVLTWALYALAGVAGTLSGRLDELRIWMYPPAIVLTALSAWRLWSLVRRMPPWPRRVIEAALALLLLSAGHDYLYYAGWLSPDDGFWLPYLTPVLMAGVALVLLRRFVHALEVAERHGEQLELRVAERTRDLQAANAAKTRFIAAASHDLRQPVASIGLLAGLMREREDIDAGQRSLLDRLAASAQALERLLKGLLDLSRFDAGQVESRPRAVPLQALVESVLADEAAAAQSRGLRLRARAGGWTVQADPVLLEQILRNLVGNAVRHTAQGGVLVSARRRGSAVLLQVWDTGVGIAPERQAQVFEEFVQLEPGQGHAGGLGLGLALVRRAAALMGTSVDLRSAPGRGSCFGLLLPLVGAPPAPPVPQRLSVRSLGGRRMVVVDDDDTLRETLRLRLERWGALVQAYRDLGALRAALGRGALNEAPALLLTDQRLPDGDSRAVVDCLATRHADVPVLVITGDTAPADLAVLEALGWPVLHKPFGTDALFSAVVAALRR